MFCPSCSRSYDDEIKCPRCAVQLVSEKSRDDPDDPLPPHWSRNPWGRTILGVILAQGLFFIIHELVAAGKIAVGDDAGGTWATLSALLTVQALQLVALLMGSMLAGAGQKNGPVYGSFVGVWSGIFSVLIQSLQGEQVTAIDFYSQPILHTVFGGVGGLLGSWIWKPASAYLAVDIRSQLPKPSAEFLAGVLAGQISWVRVGGGLVIAVGGFVWADAILAFVLKTSDGRMSIRTSMQQTLMTYEIMGLALFLGGTIAGMSTWNGTMQGLWVGLLSAALLVGIRIGYSDSWDLNYNVILSGAVLFLCTLGGTFGAKLLPPVVKQSNRYRPSAAI
jgi:hypothetical protein